MSEPVEGNSDDSDADITLSKNTAGQNPSLSEVGLPPTSTRMPDLNNENSNTSDNGVPAEFFSQMLQMMRHVSNRLVTLPDSKVKINDVFLPSYDPDANVGVREWCQHVTTAMETYNLSDYDVRMKAGSLLKGRARLWVDNWLVSTTSWEELRDVLITFEPENRYLRDVVRFREHTYDNSKDIAQFLSQAWVLWRRITKDKLSNDDAVETVIGCIGDERLRFELLNVRATSVPELISVASSIRRIKRPCPSTSNIQHGPAKRPRFSDKPSLLNDRYLVKRVIGRGRPRKVAYDQLRRAPQPGEQETVSTDFNDDTQQHTTSQQDNSSSAGVNNDTQQHTTAQLVDAPTEPLPSTSQAAQLLGA